MHTSMCICAKYTLVNFITKPLLVGDMVSKLMPWSTVTSMGLPMARVALKGYCFLKWRRKDLMKPLVLVDHNRWGSYNPWFMAAIRMMHAVEFSVSLSPSNTLTIHYGWRALINVFFYIRTCCGCLVGISIRACLFMSVLYPYTSDHQPVHHRIPFITTILVHDQCHQRRLISSLKPFTNHGSWLLWYCSIPSTYGERVL